MKALFLFFTILFCTKIFCQSRCEKGTWIFGLNPIQYSFLNTSKTINYVADTLVLRYTGKTDGISFGFNMGAGYFIKDNFCIGAGFGNTYTPTLNTTPVFPTTLFAGYYLMQKNHCFSFTKQDNTKRYAFFIQGAISGGYSVLNSENNRYNAYFNTTVAVKSKNTTYVYGGMAAIGYTYIIAKHVAFELMGIYSNNTYATIATINQNAVVLPTTKSINNNSGFNLLFGVQVYF